MNKSSKDNRSQEHGKRKENNQNMTKGNKTKNQGKQGGPQKPENQK